MKRRAALGTVIAIAILLFGWFGASRLGTEPSALPNPTVDNPNQVSTNDTWLFVDAWSHRSAGSPKAITVTSGPFRATADLQPLMAEHLEMVIRDRPELVTRIAKRMISADPDLTCTPSGCEGQSGTIDLNELVEFDDAPLAEFYESWGMTTPTYVGFLSIPAGVQTVEVALGSSAGSVSTVSQVSGRLDPNAPQSDSPMAAGLARANAIGVGWGRAFELLPSWTSGSDPYPAFSERTPVPAVPNADQLPEPSFLMSGLADDEGSLALLDPPTMSALTSPTLACLGAALCIPGSATTQTERLSSATGATCAKVWGGEVRMAAGRMRDSVHGQLPAGALVLGEDGSVVIVDSAIQTTVDRTLIAAGVQGSLRGVLGQYDSGPNEASDTTIDGAALPSWLASEDCPRP